MSIYELPPSKCPIKGCDWPIPNLPAVSAAAAGVASAFGLGVGLTIAVEARRLHRDAVEVERLIREHMEAHGPDDWLPEITRLQMQVNGMVDDLNRARRAASAPRR